MVRALVVLTIALAACKSAPEPKPEAEAVEPAPAPQPAPAPEPQLEAPKLRLPEGARPLSQAIELRVVPGDDTFSGSVTLEVELTRPLEVLWLNATELTPGAATIGGAPAKAKVVGEHHLALLPSKPLQPGKTVVKLEYTGPLSKKNTAGLFQLREGDVAYAYTHFEPLDARRAFPCFDEPSFKIPWAVTLRHKVDHLAFANTPIASAADEAGMRVTRFQPTQPLPSYLVALAVGPFDVVDGGRWGKNKVPLKLITPKGKGPDARYAVEVTGPILEQLEAYFGIPYPYEKLDSISLPVNTGAMENPGLVTYGHQLMLSRVAEDTPGRQRSYASVCAHELAHQWFGDLVTMAWWDDLWLNEAFATWMTTKVIAAWKPKWDADVSAVQRRSGALGNDGLANARRVRQPIEANDDIVNAFDGITYGKGASVISMFESWVTPEAFQKGVKRYLEQHAHRNATAADFLAAISAEAGRDVATPFNTFLDQPGAPRVAMELTCAKGSKPKLQLAQRRQLPVGSTADAKKTWSVPVCVRYSVKGKQERACTLLTGETGELALESARACPDWVLPNDKMQGHYRASLSGAADLPSLLTKARKELSVGERVGVLGDMRALVGSGDLDLSAALTTVPLIAGEENRHLVNGAMGLAWSLNDVVVPEALRPKAEAFIRHHFAGRAKKLGMQVGVNDDEDTRLLRPDLLDLVASDGKDPGLRKQALELAAMWLADRRSVHADLVDTVLIIAADTGDPALHGALLDAVKVEKDRADRNRMLTALSQFREAALVKAQLPLALGAELDPRESMRLVWGAAGDFRTRDLAVEFVEKNWDALVARLPKDSGAGLVFVAGGYCDEKPRDAARAFFDGRSTKYLGGPRNFAIAFEGIDLCMAYRARQRPVVSAFLEKWKP
jgi:alanyl aminopeptidase